VAQAARDLNVHENFLRKWVREFGSDPVKAFPGHGQMKPEHQEIERLKREVIKLKAERDIPKKGRSLLREGSDMKLVFIAKHRTIDGASFAEFAESVLHWRPEVLRLVRASVASGPPDSNLLYALMLLQLRGNLLVC
jgi:hypothetical protein